MCFFPSPLDVFSNCDYFYGLLSELFKLIIIGFVPGDEVKQPNHVRDETKTHFQDKIIKPRVYRQIQYDMDSKIEHIHQ